MRVFDCFLFNDENKILEIRLNELQSYVDKFVIIESKYNHQNKIKGSKIDKKLLRKFKKKIIYKYNKKKISNFNSWQTENFQRNLIHDCLKICDKNDIILISDVDEIPNLYKFNFLEVENYIYGFEQMHTMYKLNLLREKKWIGTKLCKYKNLQSPQWLRNLKVHKKYSFYRLDKLFFSKLYYHNFKIIKNGGWHFGWLRNEKEIINKINSFAHIEYLNTKINNKDYIKKRILNCEDFFNEKKLKKIDSRLLPDYIKRNYNKFRPYLFL